MATVTQPNRRGIVSDCLGARGAVSVHWRDSVVCTDNNTDLKINVALVFALHIIVAIIPVYISYMKLFFVLIQTWVNTMFWNSGYFDVNLVFKLFRDSCYLIQSGWTWCVNCSNWTPAISNLPLNIADLAAKPYVIGPACFPSLIWMTIAGA